MKETVGNKEMMKASGALEKADRKQAEGFSGKNYQNRKTALLTL